MKRSADDNSGCASICKTFAVDTDRDGTETDNLIAKELSQSSIDERQKAYEDFHGISQAKDEDPIHVDKCLADLEVEINKIRKSTAYEKVLFLNPKYAKERRFRLMFLRATQFDVIKAAVKVIRHFDLKLELFGMDKLAKNRLTLLDDLLVEEDDKAFLLGGLAQILPKKDRSGRPIFFYQQTLALNNYTSQQSMVSEFACLSFCRLLGRYTTFSHKFRVPI
jgi:hypothetical protein